MRRTLVFILFITASLTLGRPVAEAQGSNDPKPVIRQLVMAMFGKDVEAFNRVTTEHPLRSRLTTGGTPDPDRVRRLKEDPASIQIREQRPILFKGKPVESGEPPVGATALYIVAPQGGGPMVMPMVKRPDGWKADVRWWIAGQQMTMSSAPPPPEHIVIRQLLIAMLGLDKREAVKHLADARGLDMLFLGAPRQREPSGVLEANVMEMPLVEIGAGEFYFMPGLPDGKVIEGGSTDRRKVIVGLFGPVEMPFVLTRVGGSWKVVAEPYFALLMQ